MSTKEDKLLLIYYYLENDYCHSALLLCDELRKRRESRSTADAVRELEGMRRVQSLELAVLDALIYCHETAIHLDEMALENAKTERKSVEKKCSDSARYLDALFHYFIGNYSVAGRLVGKIMEDIKGVPVLLVNIRIALSYKKKSELSGMEESYNEMDRLCSQYPPNLFIQAKMASAKYLTIRGKFLDAMEVLNSLMVQFDWYFPAAILKARMFLMKGDYEQTEDDLTTLSSKQPTCLEAKFLLLFIHLISVYQGDRVADLTAFCEELYRLEPTNSKLFFSYSSAIAAISGKQRAILRLAQDMVTKAIDISPHHSDYYVERGMQLSFLNDYRSAKACFSEAINQDESNTKALYGQIYCQIKEGLYKDATDQIQFITAINDSVGTHPFLLYLEGLLAWYRDQNPGEHAISLHKALVRRTSYLPNSPEWFVVYNPSTLQTFCDSMLEHVPVEPVEIGFVEPEGLKEARNYYEELIRKCPGIPELQVASSKIKFIMNETQTAENVIKHVLERDDNNIAAYLLKAKIAIVQLEYKDAQECLDDALSHDFNIRDNPLFNILTAEVAEKRGEYQTAQTILEGAMKLPGIRAAIPPGSTVVPPTITEKASLFILLARIYSRLKLAAQAKELIAEALHMFQGSPMEGNIVLAQAEQALIRGDAKNAFKILSAVKDSSPSFVRVQMVKADIYLTQLNNKRRYIECYKKIIDQMGSPDSHILAGDAFMRIRNPKLAIAVDFSSLLPSRRLQEYEDALSDLPQNSALSFKIGKAYISIHQYKQALEKFELALRNDFENADYRYALSELNWKLGNNQSAKAIITDGLMNKDNHTEICDMIKDVKLIRLLAMIFKSEGDTKSYEEKLKEGINMNQKILFQIKSDQTSLLAQQKTLAAEMSFEVAKLYQLAGKNDQALTYYKQSLKNDDAYIPSMLELTKLYLQGNNAEEAEKQCIALLKVSPENEEAVTILSNLFFDKNDFTRAIENFQDALAKKADNFAALYRLIRLMYRSGDVRRAEPFLASAERVSEVSRNHPGTGQLVLLLAAGFFYCKGLYLRLINDPHEAVQFLNRARQSLEWSGLATELMVQIYLNPESQKQWEIQEVSYDTLNALKVADWLLTDPYFQQDEAKRDVFRAYSLMYTQDKSKVQEAIQLLSSILQSRKNYVPAILALATACMIDNSPQKAKNHLKSVSKNGYNQLDAEDFEDAWMLLADLNIQSGQMDAAKELCELALSHNLSCFRALEHMGMIAEKGQDYPMASDYYRRAWILQSKSNPAIGYKLAWNLIKSKQYLETVDVCLTILKEFPTYPQVREELLNRAYTFIRL